MNIEKTISEQAVSDILAPMLESQDRIVTEDVAPLFEQATGLDTPPASGTVTTTIEESRSVITAIIRKAWTAPLTMLCGASVIGYITAAYTYLRTRLQGNETYGIPDRRSEISASSPLAANLALLNDRKISGVNAEVPDGVSMGRLLCDGTMAAMVTEIIDDNTGTYNVSYSIVQRLFSIFPNITSALLNIKELTVAYSQSAFISSKLKRLRLPYLEIYNGIGSTGVERNAIVSGTQIEELDLSALTTMNRITANSSNPVQIARDCSTLRRVYLTKMASFWTNMNSNSQAGTHFQNCPNIEVIKVGRVTSFSSINITQYGLDSPMTKLIRLEFGEGTAISLNLAYWNPSYILSDNPTGTDLIEEGSTAQNNLQQFLSNFKTYIAERLAKYTGAASGKPLLTLSQPVRNAIEADGIASYIKNDRNWEISPEPNNQ